MTRRPTVPPFVDEDWVRAHEGDVVLVHVGWHPDARDPRDDYLASHLPGAVFASVDDDLAAPPTAHGGRHPLPDPATFAATLGGLGVPHADGRPGAPTAVVAYDHGGGMLAARLVWMLRAIGEDAAVLDGGLLAWEGGVAAGEPDVTPVARDPRPWPPELLVDADAVAELAADPDARVLDARAPERFRGDTEPIDARAGHVPGAVNAPFADNLRDGRLRPVQELRALHADALATPRLAASCGSGVTACHDLLVLDLLGRPDAALFVGSWSAWSADPARPVAVGT